MPSFPLPVHEFVSLFLVCLHTGNSRKKILHNEIVTRKLKQGSHLIVFYFNICTKLCWGSSKTFCIHPSVTFPSHWTEDGATKCLQWLQMSVGVWGFLVHCKGVLVTIIQLDSVYSKISLQSSLTVNMFPPVDMLFWTSAKQCIINLHVLGCTTILNNTAAPS